MERADIQIIELTPDRWREYRALRLTALQTDPIAFGSTYEASVAFPDELWQSRLNEPTSILLFAEHRGRLVGMMGVLFGADGESTVARIIAVFVELDQRRRGVARLLLGEILTRLAARPEITRARLSVTETQEAAIALYQSFGFVFVGRHKGQIRDDGRTYDELVMERDNNGVGTTDRAAGSHEWATTPRKGVSV